MFPNLRSLRVSRAGAGTATDPLIPPPNRFPVLQDLTLHGYRFHAESPSIDALWPEICQLTSLRLENCRFNAESLPQTLRRTTPKLQSLALFAVFSKFTDQGLPPYFGDSLQDLWIERRHWGCWCIPKFSLLNSLRSLHIDWCSFSEGIPWMTPNLLSISIAIPEVIAYDPPNYDQFEASLEHLSQDLPNLKLIRVLVDRRYPPVLKHQIELRRKLRLQGIRLIIELVFRGKRTIFLPSCTLFIN